MNISKKTKIVCTIGPATSTVEQLTALAEAGMNVARLNFSHGDFSEHQARVDNVRKVNKAKGINIGIMQDLSGPKIRIGDFKDGVITLKEGATFTLTTEKIVGDETKVSINYPLLPKEVKVGGHILIHDGRRKLVITAIKGKEVICKVVVGGEIKSRRGVNLPGAYLSISSITEKDRADFEFAVKNKVDFVALSFVRRPADVAELRSMLNKAKLNAQIISKIETPEALENIDEILKLTDAVMVARGDLAVEIPAEDVPFAQKMLIEKCNALGKPVITATQMLESMIKSPVPTRAEVSDVANAIIDGTDAIMLSEETTLGEFPVEAVKTMSRIAHRVEKEIFTYDSRIEYSEVHGLTDIISQSAVLTAHEAEANFIAVLTDSGNSARMIARYRPARPIVAITSNAADANKLSVSFGCYPVVTKRFASTLEITEAVREVAKKHAIGKKGDKVVVVAGLPVGKAKENNSIIVETL